MESSWRMDLTFTGMFWRLLIMVVMHRCCQKIDHILFYHVSVKGYAMVIEFYVTKMKNRGDKVPPEHCYKCYDCFHWYYATHKNHKKLNEFAIKLHDLPSKLDNLRVFKRRLYRVRLKRVWHQLKIPRKNQILCQGYNVATLCTCMMVKW